MTAGRILALDVGDRRIGLAITDALGLTAQPLFTIHRTNLRADLKSIARFIRQHSVTAVIVGHPLHADGSPSPQSAKAEVFADALRQAHPTLTHHLFDERLTTLEAHALLDRTGPARRSAGRSERLARKQLIDQVAATLLLQSFLSTKGPVLLPDPDEAHSADAEPDAAAGVDAAESAAEGADSV
jgi:putative Holliday junction resolvase